MDELELRKRQLARLRGEVVEPPIGSALEFMPDPRLEAEHREVMQSINVQPENPPEETPFIVGNRRDRYGDLEALPWPRWPSPGEPKTAEISGAHFEELILVMDANQSLQRCVRLLASRQPDWHEGTYSQAQLYESTWNFLMGLWRSRSITPPSDERMNLWAKEYAAMKRRARIA